MKYIKLFEDYSIDNIYSWWSGIKVSENDDFYFIRLYDVYLTNKIFQLKNGLRGIFVNFYCKNHMKYEEFKVYNVEIDSAFHDLILKSGPDYLSTNDNVHVVDLSKPIKIPKMYVVANKYNI